MGVVSLHCYFPEGVSQWRTGTNGVHQGLDVSRISCEIYSFHVHFSILKLTHNCVDFYLSHFLYPVCLHLFLYQSLKYPNAANADVKDIKEGKEGKEGQDMKEGYKDGQDTELSRSVSVMSSLSYRKRSNLKDSIGGTGDESSLFSTLKEQPDTPDRSSLRKAKNKSNEKAGDDLDDRDSVITQAYSEATSRARKGLERRWTKSSPEFDKESVVSSVALSRTSLRRGLDQDNDATSTVSGYGLRRNTSRMDDCRSDCGSAVSPGLSRRSGGRSPGSISLSSRTSLARSCRLSEFDVNLADDDAVSVAFSEGGISSYGPRSLGRSLSSPAPSRSTGGEALDDPDIKPVSHRNYLDPDLEKAINEVLSFKPIKFQRRSLEDSDEDNGGAREEDDDKSIRSMKSSLQYDDDDIQLHRSTSRLQRSESGSALDYTRSSSSFSSRSRSSSRKGKKKKNEDSESESLSGDERRKSSKKKGKKASRKAKKKESESESSESESSDSSSSSSSTVSFRSSKSIKKGPGRGAAGSDKEVGLDDLAEERPLSRKEERRKKKKMDSLVMKYLYRPDSD